MGLSNVTAEDIAEYHQVRGRLEPLAQFLGLKYDEDDVRVMHALDVIAGARAVAGQRSLRGAGTQSSSDVEQPLRDAEALAAQIRELQQSRGARRPVGAASTATQANACAVVAMLRKRNKPVPDSLRKEAGEI